MASTLMVKLYRGLALHCIKSSTDQNESLETAIGFLMDQLSANDTVVRFAASKALAKVASHLEQDMATQILETILAELEQDMVIQGWNISGDLTPYLSEETALQLRSSLEFDDKSIRKLNYGNAGAQKWHGLMLTLSHFVLQRSVPTLLLPQAMDRLLDGLNFEQKNSLGTSVGTNVRDAACLGVWALARKFSTDEILKHAKVEGFLQALASNLVVTACLDPAGNVRRGASAALQEMVGRHPNNIECGPGLALLQVVDYHAVASRWKAMNKVVIRASIVSGSYWHRLNEGLMSWRGSRFEDVDSRRDAAAQIRRLAAEVLSKLAVSREGGLEHTIFALKLELLATRFSQIIPRHGLLCALARVIASMAIDKSCFEELDTESGRRVSLLEQDLAPLWKTFHLAVNRSSGNVIEEERIGQRSQLTLEAQAKLVSALSLSAALVPSENCYDRVPQPSDSDWKMCFELLSTSIMKVDQRNAKINAEAIGAMLYYLPQNPDLKIERSLRFISKCLQDLSGSKGVQRFGLLAAVAVVYWHLGDWNTESIPLQEQVTALQQQAMNVLVAETKDTNQIELRTFSLEMIRKWALRVGGNTILDAITGGSTILDAIQECLDDYTIDQRGDIGSLVRMEAIATAQTAIEKDVVLNISQRQAMIAKICGLAVEKLDKVRLMAARCLQKNWARFGLASHQQLYAATLNRIRYLC